jgi:hypothetical protein
MADRFSRAMMEQVTGRPLSVASGRQSELNEALNGPIRRDPELEAELDAVRNGDRDPTPSPVPDARSEWETDASDDGSDPSDGEPDAGSNDAPTEDGDDAGDPSDVSMIFDPASGSDDTDAAGADDPDAETEADDESPTAATPTTTDSSTSEYSSTTDRTAPDDPLITRLRDEIESLDDVSAEMLRQYRRYGPMEPQEAHSTSGGFGDRRPAYTANRGLRQRGLVAHVGCGQYDYALEALVREELTNPLRPEDPPRTERIEEVVEAVERVVLSERPDASGSEQPEPSAENSPASDAEWPSVGL